MSDRFVNRWAVGVTTAPRARPTLPQCLSSLAAAGWTSPRLFAEPEAMIPDFFACLPASCRDVVLGAFPNWLTGLHELFMRDPRADAYFMCQDDVLFSAGLREYLETTLWPGPRIGVVSVYCPSHYSKQQAAGFVVQSHGWSTWGALAYIFSNPGIRCLLSDIDVLNHRHHGPTDGTRNIDSVVGGWCDRHGLPYYVHVPSLAQHIGDTSTIYPSATASGRRRAKDFSGEIVARPYAIDDPASKAK